MLAKNLFRLRNNSLDTSIAISENRSLFFQKKIVKNLIRTALGLFVALQGFAAFAVLPDADALSLIEATTPLSADSVPFVGTFYSAQNPKWPPLPSNINDLPAWDLGGGIYLLDDLDVDYSTPLRSGRGMRAMDDLGGGGGYGSDSFTYTFDTNSLWLEITNVSNGLAYVNLHNASNYVYEIYSKTDLTLTNWSIESEVFPSDTNVMPFIVPESNRANLFLWARDWTGITSCGNETPEWWFWEYFGTTNLSDTNLDSTGYRTLFNDYTYGIDPNVIQFSLQFTNTYLNTSPAYGSVTITNGIPSYMAILVNDMNETDAVWQPYTSTNVIVPLTGGNGIYTVIVGLHGLPADAAQTWLGTQLTLNTVAPVFVITNPMTTIVSKPMIQLQGLVSEPLSELTYDVSNAAGVVTNQTGYLIGQSYDTNLLAFTTNYFQCYDIKLTNGLNTITLHATDLEGNTATTNVSYTLDYSGDTNAPVLTVIWPTNGTSISGSNFTLQAQLDDETATVTASIVDTNGDTNVVQGLVERDGTVWVQNLPLAAGTNTVTLTATNAAGNTSVTNFNVIENDVGLVIDPLTSDQLNQSSVTVTGSIGDPADDCVWVNGVQAYYTDDDGDWEADNVPVSPTGMASLNVQVYTGDPVLIGSQTLDQPQPSSVQVGGYEENYQELQTIDNFCNGSQTHFNFALTGNWTMGLGGLTWDSKAGQSDWPADDPPAPPWSYAAVYQGYSQYLADDENDCKGQGISYYTVQNTTKTLLQLVAGGPAQGGVQRLIRLTMSATLDDDDATPVSPATNPFHILGQTLVPTATNAYVGETYILQPAGSAQTFAPTVTGASQYNFTVQPEDVDFGLTVISNSAVQIDATNWAVVKSPTNDYVIVQATLSDTNLIPSLTWSGGEAVPGNPLQREVSKTTSAETTVKASLGSTNLSLNVWVIWSTVTILTSGTKPANAPSFEGSIYPGDQLGVQYYFDDGTNSISASTTNCNIASGKICAVATITPAGVHSLIPNGWNFLQQAMAHDFVDGVSGQNNSNVFYFDTWTNDNPLDNFKDVNPDSNDKIYAIDGPSVTSVGQDSTEIYDNFYNFITWSNQMCSDTNYFWHFQARWKINQTPAVTFIDLGTNLITLPTASYYPPP
jgi:hypothetical protein